MSPKVNILLTLTIFLLGLSCFLGCCLCWSPPLHCLLDLQHPLVMARFFDSLKQLLCPCLAPTPSLVFFWSYLYLLTRFLHMLSLSSLSYDVVSHLLLDLQPLHPHLHVISLARVLLIVPSPCHHLYNVGLLHGVRVPVLDQIRLL